jgi:hypothetical protein
VNTRRFLPVLLTGCALSLNAQTILLNDGFADGERTTDSPPASARWTYGAHHATAASAFTSLNASAGNLLWDHTNGANSFSGIWAHFVPGSTPITLSLGETLRLDFDVSFSGGAFSTQTNSFRWGLFDSNDSRVTADFAGTNATGIASGSTFNSWRGYVAQLPVGTAANGSGNFSVRERVGSGSGLYTSTEYADVIGTGIEEPLFTSGSTYAGWLTVTRTASGIETVASIAGVTTNLGVDATPAAEFDTVSFFVLDSLTHNVTLDNVQVQVVPEPAAGLLLGAFAVVRLAQRRRQRSTTL